MKPTIKLETVYTDKLTAAAACLAMGCRLVDTRRLPDGNLEFVISGDGASTMLMDYNLGQARGNLRQFMLAFDQLRTIVRQKCGQSYGR